MVGLCCLCCLCCSFQQHTQSVGTKIQAVTASDLLSELQREESIPSLHGHTLGHTNAQTLFLRSRFGAHGWPGAQAGEAEPVSTFPEISRISAT